MAVILERGQSVWLHDFFSLYYCCFQHHQCASRCCPGKYSWIISLIFPFSLPPSTLYSGRYLWPYLLALLQIFFILSITHFHKNFFILLFVCFFKFQFILFCYFIFNERKFIVVVKSTNSNQNF